MPSQGSVYETGVCLSVTLFALLAVAFAENISISLPPVLDHGPPPHVLYNAGKTVSLPCRGRDLPSEQPPARYEWFRNGERLEENQVYSFYSQDGDTSLRISTSPGYNEVEGYFQCKVSNGGGTAMSNMSLLQAAVFKRVHRDERTESPFEGNAIKLPCDHVRSIPPPAIRWVTVGCSRGCADEQQITLDDRISIDDNGSLMFSHVLPEDSEGDRVYKCIAFNPIRRKSIGGSYTKIQVTGGSSQNRVPRVMYSTESPVIALRGSNITLKCFFAGIPTPNVTWTKEKGTNKFDNSNIKSGLKGDKDQKSHSIANTHTLHLTNIQDRHSGYYNCLGQNAAGNSFDRIKLEVEAAPVVLKSPQSMNVSLGGMATFTCTAEGVPPPLIQWYRNDQLINNTNNSTNLTLHWHTNDDNSLLTIEITKRTDTSTIHCNVTNRHGSLLLGAYLLVYEEEQTPPPDVTTEEADDINDLTEVEPPVAGTGKNLSNVIDNLPPDGPEVILSPDPHSEVEPGGVAEESKSRKLLSYERLMDTIIPIGVFILLVIIIVFTIVTVKRCKRGKRTYKVGEREKRLGRSDNDEYDSDDSGYPDDRPAHQLVHHIRQEEAPTEICVLEAVV